MTDEELIKEFQDNNTIEAYELLVKRFKDPLINFVYRFLGDKDACIDVVQDTMIKFYLNKDSYKSFAKFSTWIYTIAGNLAKNELKRRRRRTILSLSNDDEERSIQVEDKAIIQPDRAADNEIKSEMVQRALMRVKAVYREVVILRDIQGLSYEEISEMTGLSLGTVKSRINRGRSQLQELLKNIYKD
ncbi:MAG: sigma-70 family RNA polymerase sigma factor [Melioribacteraceae bacterium]|nr:sigma-70 family RNA polymerase sigma factor [Melioribacteraceae bacterium]MCF8263958.1 sigma-70 family RNA polymerase sigma factor [Melioribacteraceae bacterium]MCF8411810.1 sigma-70 family RNA polymerase sigma factor [Melioribacteraceae bacterium]MCF8431328.1 sigma-70 family RNA polymerase sigma factor [Melioribacteraceae bacterium]